MLNKKYIMESTRRKTYGKKTRTLRIFMQPTAALQGFARNGNKTTCQQYVKTRLNWHKKQFVIFTKCAKHNNQH